MPVSQTILFWSERGAIACKMHAPLHRSDTWNYDRWQKITPDDRLESVKMGVRLRCLACK